MRRLAALRRGCAAAACGTRHQAIPARSGGGAPPLQRRRSSTVPAALAAAATTPPAAATSASSAAAPPAPLPAAPWSLYAHPPLYDALFGFRDFGAEAAFVAAALAKHGSPPGAPLTSFLDAGCGPARHARAAAAAGCSPSIALDASPAMLAYAAAEAQREGLVIRTAAADLTAPGTVAALALPPLDAALAALGTLAHATHPGAPLAAFTALASTLRTGGVLVIELAAADDVFDGALIGGDAWDVPGVPRGVVEAAVDETTAGPAPVPARASGRPPPPPQPSGFGGAASKGLAEQGGQGEADLSTTARLVVEYGSPADPWNACTQVLTRTVRVTEALPTKKAARGGGGGGGGKKGGAGSRPPPSRLIGEEAVPQRVFTPQEVRLLAAAAGLEVVGEYGDMDLGVAAVGEGGDRWVGVLVKK